MLAGIVTPRPGLVGVGDGNSKAPMNSFWSFGKLTPHCSIGTVQPGQVLRLGESPVRRTIHTPFLPGLSFVRSRLGPPRPSLAGAPEDPSSRASTAAPMRNVDPTRMLPLTT